MTEFLAVFFSRRNGPPNGMSEGPAKTLKTRKALLSSTYTGFTLQSSMASNHDGASPMWENMWAGGLAPGAAFDCNGPSATLVGALSRLPTPPPGSSAFVPGCGRGYDCLALASHGFDRVVGLELSSSAATAAREYIAGSGSPHAEKVIIEVGDFFLPDVLPEAKFDLVWVCLSPDPLHDS